MRETRREPEQATQKSTAARGGQTAGAGRQHLRVQLRRSGNLAEQQALLAAPSDLVVQREAAEGVRGSGGSLPHLQLIQAAFGRHDVSGVRAHVGGEAATAAQAIGAEAYATGSDVAFAQAPSLHTAAHEAAHVVQQRGGVQLKGGVGAAGDAYERHADEVVDAVVAGRSAEALLDRHAGSGGGAGGARVQRKEARGGSGGRIQVQAGDFYKGKIAIERIPLFGPLVADGTAELSIKTKDVQGHVALGDLADKADGSGEKEDRVDVRLADELEVEASLEIGIGLDLVVWSGGGFVNGKVKFSTRNGATVWEGIEDTLRVLATELLGQEFDLEAVQQGLLIEWFGACYDIERGLVATHGELTEALDGIFGEGRPSLAKARFAKAVKELDDLIPTRIQALEDNVDGLVASAGGAFERLSTDKSYANPLGQFGARVSRLKQRFWTEYETSMKELDTLWNQVSQKTASRGEYNARRAEIWAELEQRVTEATVGDFREIDGEIVRAQLADLHAHRDAVLKQIANLDTTGKGPNNEDVAVEASVSWGLKTKAALGKIEAELKGGKVYKLQDDYGATDYEGTKSSEAIFFEGGGSYELASGKKVGVKVGYEGDDAERKVTVDVSLPLSKVSFDTASKRLVDHVKAAFSGHPEHVAKALAGGGSWDKCIIAQEAGETVSAAIGVQGSWKPAGEDNWDLDLASIKVSVGVSNKVSVSTEELLPGSPPGMKLSAEAEAGYAAQFDYASFEEAARGPDAPKLGPAEVLGSPYKVLFATGKAGEDWREQGVHPTVAEAVAAALKFKQTEPGEVELHVVGHASRKYENPPREAILAYVLKRAPMLSEDTIAANYDKLGKPARAALANLILSRRRAAATAEQIEDQLIRAGADPMWLAGIDTAPATPEDAVDIMTALRQLGVGDVAARFAGKSADNNDQADRNATITVEVRRPLQGPALGARQTSP